MRSPNLIKGTRRKNGYSQKSLNEEGVFKTSRGLFIVKVMQSGKRITIGEPFTNKKEAITTFNNYKNK